MRLTILAVALWLTFACRAATHTAQVVPDAPPGEMAPEETAAAEDPAPAEEPEEPYTNTLKWTTASEVDNFGFDVFRGDGPDGPFERINAETIEGAGTSDEPHDYQYVDDTIDPTSVYFYYVESIAMDGVRERFTPVYKAGPKVQSDEGETAPDRDGGS